MGDVNMEGLRTDVYDYLRGIRICNFESLIAKYELTEADVLRGIKLNLASKSDVVICMSWFGDDVTETNSEFDRLCKNILNSFVTASGVRFTVGAMQFMFDTFVQSLRDKGLLSCDAAVNQDSVNGFFEFPRSIDYSGDLSETFKSVLSMLDRKGKVYGDSWREFGARGIYPQMDRKLKRITKDIWYGDFTNSDELGEPLEEVILDLIIHAIHMRINVRNRNLDGRTLPK